MAECSDSGGGAALIVDERARRVWVRHQEVYLSPIEFQILRRLVADRPRPFTNEALMRDVWDNDTGLDLLAVGITRLRRKIESDPENPEIIRSSPGGGYYMDVASAELR